MMNLNYLNTPISKIVDPPIKSSIQSLPLEKLSWEDFEKLCLALVQTNFSIDDCEIYGVKGEKQAGIDIFAKNPNNTYNSYQCKKYKKIIPNDLDLIIKKFRSNQFFEKSSAFYICTSCSLNSTILQDKFEQLKTQLKSDKKTLVKWDNIQLNKLLKTQPQIVYDFFGKEWVKAFNGPKSLNIISKSKKLDAVQINNFRCELYNFYSLIFNIQDPGIASNELESSFRIQDRFIIPDILIKVENEQENNDIINNNIPTDDELNQYSYDDSIHYEQRDNRNKMVFETNETVKIEMRISVDEILPNKTKNIIIGDPGAGKSMLLRYVILDILSPNSRLNNISLQYGKLLPVWLPFAFITKELSKNGNLSIPEILRLWFRNQSKEYLFELVELALNDERLFLVIDGIDEWNNISVAQEAISRIEIIRGLFNSQILYSSRPYGFRLLKDNFVGLNVLSLANFSQIQQKMFAEKWYEKWALTLKNKEINSEFAKKQAQSFIQELEQINDFKQLAETPLILGIFIVQKMQNSILSRNKTDALKEIVNYLINQHPLKRNKGAGVIQNSTYDFDFKDIFCELAFCVQKESNDGVISKSTAKKSIENYLIKYAGYDKAKASIQSQELIKIGANNFGIIIEKSNHEISFSHRLFQEFLTAQFLYDSEDAFSMKEISNNCINPTYHQIINYFFSLIPPKQIDSYGRFYNTLHSKHTETKFIENTYIKFLKYEVALNHENTPTSILYSTYESVVREFEFETDFVIKDMLLDLILNSIHNNRLKEKIEKFLFNYIPNEVQYSDNRLLSLQHVNILTTQQLDFIVKCIINGSQTIRYDASFVLRKHIKNRNVFNLISKLIVDCENPEILPFYINAIISEDVKFEDVNNLLSNISSEFYLVELFLIKYRIYAKISTDDDLLNIIKISYQLSYHLRQEIIDMLISGFGQSIKLKNILIESIENKIHPNHGYTIENNISWAVLLNCFSHDNKVIELLKQEFENEKYPFLTSNNSNIFKLIEFKYRSNKEIKSSIEKWLLKEFNSYVSIDHKTSYTCILVGSEQIKNIVIADLEKTGWSHWNVMTLLEGWNESAEILEILKTYFRTVDETKTGAASHFVPRIFINEKKEALSILKKILFNTKVIFRDRAILGMIEIDKDYFEIKILPKVLLEIDSFYKDEWGQYYTVIDILTKNYHTNPLVKSLLLKNCNTDNKLISSVAIYYPEELISVPNYLKTSLPLSKNHRSKIISKLSQVTLLPEIIESKMSEFVKEADSSIKGDMAMSLFNSIEQKGEVNIIPNICSEFLFYRGFDYEINRNIAFIGYLIAKKLNVYFSNINEHANEYNNDHFRTIFYNFYNDNRYVSNLMISNIVDRFDEIISFCGNDFRFILGDSPVFEDIERVWGFIAKYITKSSIVYPNLLEFIQTHQDSIENSNIIKFLSRTMPKSILLRNILLRTINLHKHNSIFAGRILGSNFKNDNEVYEIIKNDLNYWEFGKIIALCHGWQDDPILKEIFNELKKKHIQYDESVAYYLKFLFRDIDNLMQFIDYILINFEQIRNHHRYYIIPLVERFTIDNEFSNKFKIRLLSSNSMTETISFYNLFNQTNKIDDDIKLWKDSFILQKNDYGYDILSNKVTQLKYILFGYYPYT